MGEKLSVSRRGWRTVSIAMAICVLASTGCRLARPGASSSDGDPARAPTYVRRPGVDAILVLMPRARAAEEVLSGLNRELARDYDLVRRYVNDRVTPSQLSRMVDEVKPVAIVLMNNPTVRLYRRYQALKRRPNYPPAIGVLTSYLERTSVGIKDFAGIAYEVPLVTSLVNLRALVADPIRRVGVLYRPEFESFVAEQRELARLEQFEVIGVQVVGTGPTEIQRGISELNTLNVDAIWVLNDNPLLDTRTVREGWLPELARDWTPVVVNVASFVSADFNFGTYAVVPDHKDLGLQTANLLLDLASRNWRVDERRIELPVSVQTILAVNVAKRRLRLNNVELSRVTRLVR